MRPFGRDVVGVLIFTNTSPCEAVIVRFMVALLKVTSGSVLSSELTWGAVKLLKWLLPTRLVAKMVEKSGMRSVIRLFPEI